MDQILKEEREKLAKTQDCYDGLIADNREFFEALPGLYPGDPDVLNDLLLRTHNQIAKLERGKEKPYFARIDFTEEGGEAERYYIGKIGVLDDSERIVTLDWRAPVATLYYDSNVGPVSYLSPSGEVRGSLELKRMLEVEAGSLRAYHDVDTVANDELLQPYLGVNADSRLKNIIATIQSEQNRIIRENLERNLVVQGVAGSGKTTVALHRIAYLVYHHRDSIRPGQFLVIGPNQFFISYISAVLPDLDVDSVPQHTYASLAQKIVGEPFQVADPALRLAQVVEEQRQGGVERLKTSMEYKAALDRFLGDFEQSILPEGAFSLRGFEVLGRQDLLEGWSRGQESPGSTVKSRVVHCILYLSGLVENRRLLLDNQLSWHFKELYASHSGQGLDQLHKDRAWIEKELAGGCRKSLGKFFSGQDSKILALYRRFLTDCGQYLPGDCGRVEQLRKQALAGLRKRLLEVEDLPALLYLKVRVQGRGEWGRFRHAVVDEAQDFGEFDLYALQKALGQCTFTVVGDLAQSVYSYRGVDSWAPVVQQSFDKGALLLEMETCYRTTVEIMEAANRITGALGLSPAKPVIRHGAPVGLRTVAGQERVQLAADLVREFQAAGFASIALLAKTQREAVELAESMKSAGMTVPVMGPDSGEYTGGLCAMAGYFSKGLEFDGVILWDVADGVYSGESKSDLHLLYVAMTRPLHRLEMLCTGDPCPPLSGI